MLSKPVIPTPSAALGVHSASLPSSPVIPTAASLRAERRDLGRLDPGPRSRAERSRGMTRGWPSSSASSRTRPRSGVAAAPDRPHQIAAHQLVDLAVQDGVGVAGLVAGPLVLDQPI